MEEFNIITDQIGNIDTYEPITINGADGVDQTTSETSTDTSIECEIYTDEGTYYHISTESGTDAYGSTNPDISSDLETEQEGSSKMDKRVRVCVCCYYAYGNDY